MSALLPTSWHAGIGKVGAGNLPFLLPIINTGIYFTSVLCLPARLRLIELYSMAPCFFVISTAASVLEILSWPPN